MKSKTKYPISHPEIISLFASANLEPVTDIKPLGAGEYNAVYSVRVSGKEYAIKIAPPTRILVMTLEKNLMSSEIFWYEQLRRHTAIPVPYIHHSDLTRSLLPTDFFIMEKIKGQPLNEIKQTNDEKINSAKIMATMTAQMHTIKNHQFGYIQTALHDNWYEAVRAMTVDLLNDNDRVNKISKRGEKLLKYIEKHSILLAKAECSMVNFDMWPSNIIVNNETHSYALIDPERSFWGDRIADFVCLEMTLPLEKKLTSLKAYNTLADNPVKATEEEKIRYAIAQGYLGLIMETERYYRYTYGHFGWWRNVLASGMLFKQAFEVLHKS